jgi:hypothetical protein
MSVYDLAAELPAIGVLRQRCQALALLDAIIDADYYDFTRSWGEDQAASMTNGSGEEYNIVFTAAGGVFIRGLYHESPMLAKHDGLWPGLLDGLPDEFRPHVDEPAFFGPDDSLDATFVLWRRAGDDAWQAGRGIDFAPVETDETDPDGSWLLDVLLDDIAEQYVDYAEEIFEVTPDRDAVEHVVAFRPLTDEVIAAIDPEADPEKIRRRAAEIGYPVAQA